MMSKPEKEHAWLQKLIGEWTYETETSMTPGEPPKKFTGTETVRAIGDLWIQAEGKGEMPGGGAATMMLTLGYDPDKKHIVGSWFGSMMTYLWVYEGSLDAAQNTLTLNTVGPDWSGKKPTANYKEIIALKSNDHRTFTSQVQSEDGEWRTLMTANYRRIIKARP